MTNAPTAQRAAVAAEVRAWMGRRRLNQGDLAAALGKSQPYVSRRLSGEVAFDTDDLFRLADLFKVAVHRLLGDPELTSVEGAVSSVGVLVGAMAA